MSFLGKRYRLVLLGRSGDGKSRLGDSILNVSLEQPEDEDRMKELDELRFKYGTGASGITRECKRLVSREPHAGITWDVVDTVGFFDPVMPRTELIDHTARSIEIQADGPHAFLLVYNVKIRYTTEEFNCYTEIRNRFGPKAMDHVILVITNTDQLDEGETLERVLEKGRRECANFNTLMTEMEERWIAFPNKSADGKQLRSDEKEAQESYARKNGE